jgi:hypothetical protein
LLLLSAMKKIYTLSISLMILGLTPWERIFPISFGSGLLFFLTSNSIGWLGVAGVIVITIRRLNRSEKRYTGVAGMLLGILLIPIVLCELLAFILPDYRWHDSEIYRKGNEYLIIQDFQNFTTNTDVYPRVLHTTYPYIPIRLVKEKHELSDIYAFKGNVLTYKGERWHKEPLEK